jgi:CSLREA domain-containing protein
MSVRTALALAGALVISALFAGTANATFYTITETSDGITNNGNCTLREAVQAANTDMARDACAAGSLDDIITLTADDPYELTIAPDGSPDDNLDGDIDIEDADADGDADDIVRIQASPADQATVFQTANDRIFHLEEGFFQLTRLHLSGGVAGAGDGGAVFAPTADTTPGLTPVLAVQQSVFEDNSAAGGGAIAAGETTLIRDSHFIFNEATTGDGGALKLTAEPNHLIDQSSFELNDAADQGGAVWLGDGTNFDVLASSFLDNGANTGAAIHVGNPITPNRIDYVTLAGNEAFTPGGGALTLSEPPDVDLTRSILAENTDPDGPSNCDSDLQDDSDTEWNLIDVNDCGLTTGGGGNNLLDVNPQLAPANVYFGGDTVSRPPFVGSPAVDAIPNAECGGGDLDLDQYSRSRPQPGGGSCDVGAVEGAVARPIVTPPQSTPPAVGPTGERAAALKKCKTKAKKKNWSKKQLKKCKRKARRLPV